MHTDDQVRVDKWLWAIRVFKTRNLATSACRKGRVLIDGQAAKPSRVLKPDDVVQVRKPPVVYTYRVRGLLVKRLSARLVKEYFEDMTPESELEKLRIKDSFFVHRDRGAGRPSKKERRVLDKLRGDL